MPGITIRLRQANAPAAPAVPGPAPRESIIDSSTVEHLSGLFTAYNDAQRQQERIDAKVEEDTINDQIRRVWEASRFGSAETPETITGQPLESIDRRVLAAHEAGFRDAETAEARDAQTWFDSRIGDAGTHDLTDYVPRLEQLSESIADDPTVPRAYKELVEHQIIQTDAYRQQGLAACAIGDEECWNRHLATAGERVQLAIGASKNAAALVAESGIQPIFTLSYGDTTVAQAATRVDSALANIDIPEEDKQAIRDYLPYSYALRHFGVIRNRIEALGLGTEELVDFADGWTEQLGHYSTVFKIETAQAIQEYNDARVVEDERIITSEFEGGRIREAKSFLDLNFTVDPSNIGAYVNRAAQLHADSTKTSAKAAADFASFVALTGNPISPQQISDVFLGHTFNNFSNGVPIHASDEILISKLHNTEAGKTLYAQQTPEQRLNTIQSLLGARYHNSGIAPEDILRTINLHVSHLAQGLPEEPLTNADLAEAVRDNFEPIFGQELSPAQVAHLSTHLKSDMPALLALPKSAQKEMLTLYKDATTVPTTTLIGESRVVGLAASDYEYSSQLIGGFHGRTDIGLVDDSIAKTQKLPDGGLLVNFLSPDDDGDYAPILGPNGQPAEVIFEPEEVDQLNKMFGSVDPLLKKLIAARERGDRVSYNQLQSDLRIIQARPGNRITVENFPNTFIEAVPRYAFAPWETPSEFERYQGVSP